MKRMAFAATLALRAGHLPAASAVHGPMVAMDRTTQTNEQRWRRSPSRTVVTTQAE